MHDPQSALACHHAPEPADTAPADTAPADTAPADTAPADAAPAGGAEQPRGPLDLAAAWQALQAAVRARVAPEQFEAWFRRAALVRADPLKVQLAVQNPFISGWLRTYYSETLADAVADVFGPQAAWELLVDPELVVRRRADTSPQLPVHGAPAATGLAGERIESSRNLPIPGELHLNAKYTFDNFVVGPCNRFAHAACVGTAEQPGKAYNPFFLHGSVGLGKTHLLQSLCFALLERNPKTRILYLSCETFVNHFIAALEHGDMEKFRNKYRSVDVLVVDDIHLLANKERTQEEFFHTFNTLHQSGKQIVLSSDSPPKDIPTLQERLVSRFKWGLVTEIEPPCYETRMAILKRKSREKGREIPDDVARLLAERIDSNIRELEGAVTKLTGFANISGAQVTVELARQVLRELFGARRGQPSMEDVVGVVTAHFGIKLPELQSRRRTQAIAYPRQVAMYLARQVTRHSLAELGGFFGGRDHSTVLYGVGKIGQQVRDDPACRELIEGFLARLRPAAG